MVDGGFREIEPTLMTLPWFESCVVDVSLRSLNTLHAIEFCREIFGAVTSSLKEGEMLGINIMTMAKMFIPTVALVTAQHFSLKDVVQVTYR